MLTLVELQPKLPEIYRSAYAVEDTEAAQTKPFNLWGIEIDPINPATGDARVSVVLVKFLRARYGLRFPYKEVLMTRLTL